MTDKDQKCETIQEMKASIPCDTLCADLPGNFDMFLYTNVDEFAIFYRLVNSLQFEEIPNYKAYSLLFNNLLAKYNLSNDQVYDWMIPAD